MNERLENMSVPFTIVRPGGNDTALFKGVIREPNLRKSLNDLIMGLYPNVEQVGFIDLSEEPELLMAGGEFCGNATRSTSWLTLEGKEGETSIKTSGVERKLFAGVNTQGEAFSQMPFYKESDRVQQDPENNKSFIVELEGITQYVTFDTEPILYKNEEEIKTIAKKVLEAKGLTDDPAAGVIYSQKTDKGWEIKPVVYVKEIDTLFYETGCASGTTALGMVLAKQLGGSITEIPVYQPSGLPLRVSIGFNGDMYTSAQISGPIELLAKGQLEVREGLSYVVEAITSKQQLEDAFSKGLIPLYQETFAAYPYFESFSDEEVKSFFQEYLEKGLLYLAKNQDGVIGFGAALPLSEVPAVGEIFKDQDLDLTNAWYMADLGVKADLWKNGIGKSLVQARLNAIPKGGTIIMRTSEKNIPSQSLYTGLEFEQVEDLYEEVEQKRVDGSVQKDKRIFLVRSN